MHLTHCEIVMRQIKLQIKAKKEELPQEIMSIAEKVTGGH
jgi:hypothetical protein